MSSAPPHHHHSAQLPASQLPIGQSMISQLPPTMHIPPANPATIPVHHLKKAPPVAPLVPPPPVLVASATGNGNGNPPFLPPTLIPSATATITPCSGVIPSSVSHTHVVDTRKRPLPPTTITSTTTTTTAAPAHQHNNNNSNNINRNQLSEKKLRRLEKNRLSARECRRRKREATENLEREINVLEGENLRLRLQLRIGEEAEEDLGKEQDKVTEEIDALLKSGASEGEIYNTIEEFKEKFADYGRDRRSAIEFHLQNVERLLQPTQTTSVAMRALQGGTKMMNATAPSASSSTSSSSSSDAPAEILHPPDTNTTVSSNTNDPGTTGATTITASTQEEQTHTSSTAAAPPAAPPPLDNTLLEPKKLFQHLVNYLEVTEEQALELKDSRFIARELDQSLAQSLAVLQELRVRLLEIGDGMETEFNNVRSILSPTQAAKFLVWVANNRACMHMLNELWSRVYPDPSATNTDDFKPKAK